MKNKGFPLTLAISAGLSVFLILTVNDLKANNQRIYVDFGANLPNNKIIDVLTEEEYTDWKIKNFIDKSINTKYGKMEKVETYTTEEYEQKQKEEQERKMQSLSYEPKFDFDVYIGKDYKKYIVIKELKPGGAIELFDYDEVMEKLKQYE